MEDAVWIPSQTTLWAKLLMFSYFSYATERKQFQLPYTHTSLSHSRLPFYQCNHLLTSTLSTINNLYNTSVTHLNGQRNVQVSSSIWRAWLQQTTCCILLSHTIGEKGKKRKKTVIGNKFALIFICIERSSSGVCVWKYNFLYVASGESNSCTPVPTPVQH